MAELAKTVEGNVVISVNDHPGMRRVFDGLEIASVGTTYSVGGNNDYKAAELIITNFKPSLGKLMPGTPL